MPGRTLLCRLIFQMNEGGFSCDFVSMCVLRDFDLCTLPLDSVNNAKD